MPLKIGYWWTSRTHNLSRMSLRELVAAYFTYPTILAYAALGTLSAIVMVALATSPAPLLATVVTVVLVYPLVEYTLHRFVLHGRYLYKSRRTARLWKRIHFDHHQDPHDLRVLFGALHTTLPVIGLVSVPAGLLFGGPAAAAAGLLAGFAVVSVYEFCHCVEHLNFQPRWAYLARIKRLHLAHHFHNEQANYGITSHVCDRLFGTYRPESRSLPRSPTVFNLGYTEEEAHRYPWVAELSPGTRGDDNPRRFRQAGLASRPPAQP